MKKKKSALIAVGVLLAVLLVAGATTYAVNNYGSQSDPLVTLSYLNGNMTNSIMNQLDSKIASSQSAFKSSLDSAVSRYTSDILGRLSSATATTDTFSVVTLESGQNLVCAVGAEFMLREGSASAYGSLVNITSGAAVSATSSITANNLYMTGADSSGIVASGTVKILVRGEYVVI